MMRGVDETTSPSFQVCVSSPHVPPFPVQSRLVLQGILLEEHTFMGAVLFLVASQVPPVPPQSVSVEQGTLLVEQSLP